MNREQLLTLADALRRGSVDLTGSPAAARAALAAISDIATHLAEMPVIDRVEARALQTGDILTVQLPWEPSPTESAHFREHLDPVIPEGVVVFLMGPDTKFEVTRPS